jgi:D-glycero-D-manno-heptose 1,7-bisphosphate phosphatase
MKKAVFIDRDGTLNEMVYNNTHGIFDSPHNAEEVRLKPKAADFLKTIRQTGYFAIVVTNQPGIAKGTLTVERLNKINNKLSALLAAKGAGWDALLYCPHYSGPGHIKNKYWRKCKCRKPKPGLLLSAAKIFHIDLSKSWMVGDGLNDVQAGKSAGCRSILVTNLKIEQVEHFFNLGKCQPFAVARDLKQTARIIKTGKRGSKT